MRGTPDAMDAVAPSARGGSSEATMKGPRPRQLERPLRPHVPDRPTLDGIEKKWSAEWERRGTYRFDRSAPREHVYSIDTPPPTVSGSLHIGHVFSFTHTDTVARYRRALGYQVFYPIGWDDNGLATERRVQNYYGVRCDPSLREEADFELPEKPAATNEQLPVSRPTFVRLCERLTAEDEQVFEATWRHLGLSYDWALCYTTISAEARRASQRGFLHLLEAGHAYSSDAPTMWDVDFQTAVSQAEMEDREVPGAYYRLAFPRATNTVGGDGARVSSSAAAPNARDVVEIETTRPELLPACVALVAHPDDERYKDLFGTEVLTPLFSVRVPVLAHHLADPDKGSGIAMVCTFGDLTDVTWWRELSLPTRTVLGRDGSMVQISWGEPPYESEAPAAAEQSYDELAGRRLADARKKIVNLLEETGALRGDVRRITHAVKFYERGEQPLEIVSSRQWYVSVLPMRERLLELGRQLRWHPPHMVHRYEAWVEGLNGDWNISRQRFFGVPFPVWYPVDAHGVPDHDSPIVAAEDRLPVDPSSDVPDGFSEAQRAAPGGFVGDPDVMDTWATSSLTPQIAGRWHDDPDLFSRVFPMDLRPQAHDIIRTWLFSTVVRSALEHGTLPWSDVAISGWVLDPDRKKMSKSKGNVVTPLGLLEKHGSDAARYWAASGRPGVDTAFDEAQMKVGRRLAIKVLNASRFALGRLTEAGDDDPDDGLEGGAVSAPIDLSMLRRLAEVVSDATEAFERYDYTRALERTEDFFWSFCDDYLELVKARAYQTAERDGSTSARSALALALSVQLRLLAPFLPFVTEEVWSWWHEGSVHRAPWPTAEELLSSPRGPDTGEAREPAETDVLEVAASVLGEIRRVKTAAHRSMRARVARLVVTDDASRLELLSRARSDLCDAGNVEDLVTTIGDPSVEVELEPEPQPERAG